MDNLKPGTRVRLHGAHFLITLESDGGDTGTIVGRTKLDYYIVRLDKPAQYHGNIDGTIGILPEITEARDNMDVLD